MNFIGFFTIGFVARCLSMERTEKKTAGIDFLFLFPALAPPSLYQQFSRRRRCALCICGALFNVCFLELYFQCMHTVNIHLMWYDLQAYCYARAVRTVRMRLYEYVRCIFVIILQVMLVIFHEHRPTFYYRTSKVQCVSFPIHKYTAIPIIAIIQKMWIKLLKCSFVVVFFSWVRKKNPENSNCTNPPPPHSPHVSIHRNCTSYIVRCGILLTATRHFSIWMR